MVRIILFSIFAINKHTNSKWICVELTLQFLEYLFPYSPLFRDADSFPPRNTTLTRIRSSSVQCPLSEGMRQSFFMAPPWTSKISVRKEKDTIERVFTWHVSRRNKKYNASTSYIHIYLSEENLHQETFKVKGELGLGAWDSESEGITFEITTHIPSRGLICGRFSGVLTKGTDVPKKVENGFFDLKYTF